MNRVWLVLAIAGCKSPSNHDDFPVMPGGPGGTGVMIDGPLPADAFDSDAGTTIAGRVCLVSDLRALATCAATGAGGITVTLGTRMAVTTDSGAFTITTPSGSNLVWRASGVGIIPSLIAFGPSAVIPAIGGDDYAELQLANSILDQVGQGAIVARVVRAGAAVAGATVQIAPVAQYATKYDGLAATAWTELATSTAGTAWIAGVEVGTPTITATPPSGSGASESVRVEDRAITYVTVDLP
jgi:hypothetical protein